MGCSLTFASLLPLVAVNCKANVGHELHKDMCVSKKPLVEALKAMKRAALQDMSKDISLTQLKRLQLLIHCFLRICCKIYRQKLSTNKFSLYKFLKSCSISQNGKTWTDHAIGTVRWIRFCF